MKKQIFILAIVVALVLSFAGCSSGSGKKSIDSSLITTSTTTETQAGVLTSTLSSSTSVESTTNMVSATYENLSLVYNSKNSLENDEYLKITFEPSISFMQIVSTELSEDLTDVITKDLWASMQHKTFLDVFDSRVNEQTGSDTVDGFPATINSFIGVKGSVRTLSFVITFCDENYCYTILFSCVSQSKNQSDYLDEFDEIVKSISPN